MTASTATIDEVIDAYVGISLGVTRTARFEVNLPMIHHWCDAMGDANPVYTDPEAAAASVHGAIVAPPAMLQAWTMPGLRPRELDREVEVKAKLAENGYSGVVATNCEQEYFAPVKLGDQLTAEGVLESISGEKRTALGPARFVTTLYNYTNQDGVLVATHRFTIMCYQPQAKG